MKPNVIWNGSTTEKKQGYQDMLLVLWNLRIGWGTKSSRRMRTWIGGLSEKGEEIEEYRLSVTK